MSNQCAWKLETWDENGDAMTKCIVNTTLATHTYTIQSKGAQYGRCYRTLYRSSKGRWYIVCAYSYSVDGESIDRADEVSPTEAAQHIALTGQALPDTPELKDVEVLE